ncbi:MAG: HBL/NHE enterotoxin family protein [Cyanobacteria bacterium SBLK]|nr:HBL/NHE enterotoxin family protein [Cyanobacteria bacterium SBLK]
MNSAAIALSQTLLHPPNPVPTWFDELYDKLQTVQQQAQIWLTQKSPQVISQLTQDFISYNNRFQVIAPDIRANSNMSASEAVHYFQWLQRHSANLPEAVETLQSDIDRFANSFLSCKQEVEDAIAAANQTLQGDRQKVATLKQKIQQLYDKINAQTADAQNGLSHAAMSGVGVSLASVAVALALATGGVPLIPFVSLAVGLLSTTYGAISMALKERKVVEEWHEIGRLSVELTQEEQQVALLQGIVSALHSVEDALSGVKTSLDFKPIWDDIDSNTNALIAQIQQEGDRYRSLQDIQSLPFSARTWDAIAEMGTNIQRAAAGSGSDRWQLDLSSWESS